MKNSRKKILIYIILFVIISFVLLFFGGCTNKQYGEEEFKDYYYVYIEDKILHLTNTEIKDKTKKLYTGQSIKNQMGQNYIEIHMDDLIILNSGKKMFSGLQDVEIKGLKNLIVKNAEAMFEDSDIVADYKKLNVKYVTNMQRMFCGCDNLLILEINNWDTSNVKDMNYMFDECRSLLTIDIKDWNVGNVIDMDGLFRECNNLSKIDISKWNVSNVVDMKWMFYECNKLLEIKINDMGC